MMELIKLNNLHKLQNKLLRYFSKIERMEEVELGNYRTFLTLTLIYQSIKMDYQLVKVIKDKEKLTSLRSGFIVKLL